MSGDASKQNVYEVKYRKIQLKDLQFDQGDDFFVRGEFADVKRAKWNGKVVAVKCFNSPDKRRGFSQKGGFSQELWCLSVLQKHDNIVELYGACISDQPYIVLEFAQFSLEKVLHECKDMYRYTADNVFGWAYQIASALDYIHGKDMLHRDIKPSNMLLFKGGSVLKLCDFGTAKKLEHTLTNAAGTIRYMAPEVIRGRHYTERCDVFSFAIVVWEIITRKRPILSVKGQNASSMAIVYAMANGARPPMIRNLPRTLQEMISRCWDEEPQKRPPAKEIKRKLGILCQYVEMWKPLIFRHRPKPCSSSDLFGADHEEGMQRESSHYQQQLEREKREPGSRSRDAAKKLCDEAAAKKLFDEAMEKGYVESRAIVLLLIGAAGVGKSHFKHLILRLSPPAVRASTPLAEAAIRAISICRATISDGNMEWQLVSSKELLRMVADGIKAGVPVRLVPLDCFPMRVLPLHADYSDLTFTKQRTQPDGSSAQPSSDTQRSVTPTEETVTLLLHTSPTPPRSSSSIDLSLEESLDLSEPSQTKLEVELMDLIRQSSGSKKLFDVDWVYIVDSGGQPQFHEILPVFIRYASACVFITRLDKSLTDYPMIEYYGQDGQRHGSPYRSLLTHEQILERCFQALQSRQCTSLSAQSGPMVFVAGTHKDQEHHCPESRSTKNKKLLETLRPVLGDKLGLYRLAEPDQLIFPVNAKTPSREDEKVASEFRKVVTKSCPHEREKIPIPWFVLEQLIHQCATEKGVSIISMKQCQQIAHRLHMDDETFHAALDYLVALNIFHFYPTILPNVVFCDTQVLLDKISELVEYSHHLRGSSATTSSVSRMQSCSGGWLRFRDEGIITVEFLEEFPKHYVAGMFTPSDLLKLLTALLIAAHLAGSEYFMPSLLYELQPEEVNEYRCSLMSSSSPLLVHYPGGWLPSGIFTSLIAYLQNICSWKLLFKSGKPVCLHRNCVKFRHPGGRPGSITLIDSFTHFEVHLVTLKPVSHTLCSEIHRAIFDGLEQAADTLSYTNLHPEEAFFCLAGGKDCESTQHLAAVADGYWSCLSNQEVGGELTEEQFVWLSCAGARAQLKEAEEYQSPEPPTLSNPHPKPRPKPRINPKQFTEADVTKQVLSSAEKPNLHQSPKPLPKPRPKPRQKVKQLTKADPTQTVPSLADKPKLYQLQCLQSQQRRVKITQTVAAKWEDVALALHFEGHLLQNIRYDPHIHCIDTACREMFQKWLDGEGRQPVTWETLMDALVDAGFVTVVEDLHEILRN